jgi:hypothetical protein
VRSSVHLSQHVNVEVADFIDEIAHNIEHGGPGLGELRAACGIDAGGEWDEKRVMQMHNKGDEK